MREGSDLGARPKQARAVARLAVLAGWSRQNGQPLWGQSVCYEQDSPPSLHLPLQPPLFSPQLIPTSPHLTSLPLRNAQVTSTINHDQPIVAGFSARSTTLCAVTTLCFALYGIVCARPVGFFAFLKLYGHREVPGHLTSDQYSISILDPKFPLLQVCCDCDASTP